MKKIYLFSAIMIVILAAQAFLPHPNNTPIAKLKAQFETGFEQLEESLDAYETAIVELKNDTVSIKNLEKKHKEARLAYKSIEFLLEYIDPYWVKKSINGAPLPFPEPAIPDLVEVQPVGLQVLDDLVFGDNPYSEREELLSLIKKLRIEVGTARPMLLQTKLTHRYVFESARRNLIRIFTLGLTGFDTPGSLQAVPEAAASYEALEQAIRLYLPLIEQKDRGLAIVIDARLEGTRTYLRNAPGYKDFDRMQFLTEHLNPMYELLLEMHRILQIEMNDEVERLPQSINYRSKGLFEPDFLNADFFSNIDIKSPLHTQRIELGRLLFFDPVLSKDNSTSCASCHQPEKAFTDGLPKSLSNDGKHTVRRNAPTLINCVYSEHFFSDMSEPKLDRQILHVVRDSNEFDTDYLAIMDKLMKSKAYMELFKAAYADQAPQTLNAYSLSNSIACYVASLQSFDSPFDDYVTGRYGVIKPEITRGFNLFMGKALCGTCHFAPVFNGTVPPLYNESESEVLGVPASAAKGAPVDPDLGRYVNNKPRDHASFYQYSFKTPTLRNIARTAPYMHNGVYNTLEEVVTFYNIGGGQGLNIKLEHQTLPFDNLQLTEQEQKDLVAFMKSLSSPAEKFTAPDALPTFDKQPEWNNRYKKEQYRR